jgi:hypothetical protein
MRLIASAVAVVAVAATAWGVRPSFQAELDVTNTVAAVDGAAYRISGKVTDRSVMGYDGTSVAASNLVFSETITGDVDAWMVTNVVFSNAIHVVMDVVYLPLNTTNLTLEFPVGIAALCSVTENDPQYPEPPSSTGAEVSQHMMNQIRTYSFSIIPEGDKGLGLVVTNIIGNLDFVSNAAVQGATVTAGSPLSVSRSTTNLAFTIPADTDTGATGIVAGASDTYDIPTRTLTWNTNAAGGGTGDASLWYEWPARDRIAFDVLPASNYFGGEAYTQAEYKGEIGTIDWTDAAKVLVQDDDPAVLELDTGEIGTLLVTTNYSLTGGTGIFVRAVTVHSRYEGEVSDLADASILLRYGDLTWADAEVVGAHVPESSFATYSDTHTFPSPVSRNDLADLEVGFWLTNGAFGATGRVDALWVELVGAEPWDIGPEADGDFGLASGGTTRLSVSTGGTVTATAFVGDGSGLTGLPLPDLVTLSNTVVAVSNIALTASNQAAFAEAVAVAGSNLALVASNAAASVRADFDPLSNTVSTLKGQFDGSSNAVRTATLQVTGGTPTNGAVLVGTGDVGIVKWSLPVAFMSSMVGSITGFNATATNVPFLTEIYDYGNNFDGKEFVAPVNGFYMFNLAWRWLRVSGSADKCTVRLMPTLNSDNSFFQSPIDGITSSGLRVTASWQEFCTNGQRNRIDFLGVAGTTNSILNGVFSGILLREVP